LAYLPKSSTNQVLKPETTTPIRLEFWEGMNRSVVDHQMKPSEFKIVVNAVTENIGSKTKRPGYVTFLNNPDDAEVLNLFNWNSKGILFRRSGTKLYKCLVGTDTTWIEVTLPVGVTLSPTARMTSAVLSGLIFFADGTNFFYCDDTLTCTSTSFTGGGATGANTNPKYLEQYQNRIQAAGCTDNPSTLFYSKFANGTNWVQDLTDPDAAGFVYIDTDYNGDILGLKKAYDRTLIFKEEAEYRYDGSSTPSDINRNTTTSIWSVDAYKDFTFWLNYDGIWGYSGTQPSLLSIPLNDIIPSISGTDLFKAPGACFDRHYYLSIGTIQIDDITVTNGVLDMDFDKSEWFIHDYADKPTAWASYYDANKKNQLIFGDTAGNTYTNFSGNTDNGEAIQMILRTRRMDEGQPEIDKKYNKIYVQASPYDSLVVQYRIGGGNWNTIGDLYTTLTKHYFSPLISGSYSRSIEFQIIDNSDQRPEFTRLYYYVATSGGQK
jgi:hypothetical protein